MERISQNEICSLCDLLNDLMPKKNFRVESGYGMYKLTSKNGSHNESAFMSKKQLYNWMQAYKSGYYAATEAKS